MTAPQTLLYNLFDLRGLIFIILIDYFGNNNTPQIDCNAFYDYKSRNEEALTLKGTTFILTESFKASVILAEGFLAHTYDMIIIESF